MNHHRLSVALAATVVLCSSLAHADCTGFKWPLDTELGLLAADDDVAIQSGAELPEVPAKAISLKLGPAKSVAMPVAAGVKPQAVSSDTFSGWLSLPSGVKPGLYQITLSTNGWIDVAQNGALLPSKGFTGRQECKPIHKSVRYDIGPGPVTIQITGAPAETVRLTINAAN